jgi:hypothetical protein
MVTPYLGPAGQFSTDDAQADQRQIEAEQFEPFEIDDEWTEEDEARYNGGESQELIEKHHFVTAGCKTNQNWFMYEESVPDSKLDETIKAFAQKHDESCNCGGKAIIESEEV